MPCRSLLRLAGLIVAAAAFASHLQEARADEPLVVSPEVMADFAQYKARKKPLYFAVSKDGLTSWYSYCLDYNCQETQSYRMEAIKRCEGQAGSACMIFAVEDEIQVDYRVGDAATMVAAPIKPCEIEDFAPG
jgi:hypothetical protein